MEHCLGLFEKMCQGEAADKADAEKAVADMFQQCVLMILEMAE